MICGVQDIYMNVTNMEKATAFYCEALGMKVIQKDQYWTSLDCHGTRIGLHWTEGQSIPSIPKDEHGVHAGATLTLRSDNIAEDKAKLEKNRAIIIGESDAPWGHMVVVEDLDGNVLKLMNAKY
jgi:catechol-2,3-dioxygenase